MIKDIIIGDKCQELLKIQKTVSDTLESKCKTLEKSISIQENSISILKTENSKKEKQVEKLKIANKVKSVSMVVLFSALLIILL